jgi:hypothetical protein
MMRPTIHHLRARATVRAEALFVSMLQGSDAPSAAQVQDAVAAVIREFGRRGCAERVAQEFGDHPEIAIPRMRWARRTAEEAFAGSGLAAPHPLLAARRFVARAA